MGLKEKVKKRFFGTAMTTVDTINRAAQKQLDALKPKKKKKKQKSSVVFWPPYGPSK